jgi:hypothetical protein|nr:MAG TPA: hypothetical protein [Crassvirales sp.]
MKRGLKKLLLVLWCAVMLILAGVCLFLIITNITLSIELTAILTILLLGSTVTYTIMLCELLEL